jgi:hypothetical protein
MRGAQCVQMRAPREAELELRIDHDLQINQSAATGHSSAASGDVLPMPAAQVVSP